MAVKKALLRIDETMTILDCSRDHIYDLLRDGRLRAHNPRGCPGTRGTKIVATSVDGYLDDGVIPTDKWNK